MRIVFEPADRATVAKLLTASDIKPTEANVVTILARVEATYLENVQDEMAYLINDLASELEN